MQKVVIKEVKTKRKCQCLKGCDNKANSILKVKGIKKIYLCQDCIAQFFREVSNSYFEEGLKNENKNV